MNDASFGLDATVLNGFGLRVIINIIGDQQPAILEVIAMQLQQSGNPWVAEFQKIYFVEEHEPCPAAYTETTGSC